MLRLNNTLNRKVEEIIPREPGLFRMYTCGPTVYRYAHLGNLRSYLVADWIRRALEQQGGNVIHVKNITDVGHMRQELLERGGDKIVLAALAEGKTSREIAQFYTEAFNRDEACLNIISAHHLPKATDHVEDMIGVIIQLLKNGHAYEIEGTVYFDVSSFPGYGKLSGNISGNLMEGVRTEVDPRKRDIRDFTLWKSAEPGREMKWMSPWGEGFPGWHIECSAMSVKYLGDEVDIHTGGVDNIFPHHEDEIAQSEGAFGKQVVQYWVHGQHLLVDGVKMSKSARNDFTLDDLKQRGFAPLAFGYLCLTSHYLNRLNFTFSALRSAERALTRLRDRVWEWRNLPQEKAVSNLKMEHCKDQFWKHVDNDLDMPSALALTWNVVRSNISPKTKLAMLQEFDSVLGLGLATVPTHYNLPSNITSYLKTRFSLRVSHDYGKADRIRKAVESDDFIVLDHATQSRIRPKTAWERRKEQWPSISSSREVPSLLSLPATKQLSFVVIACNYLEDVQRCINSVICYSSNDHVEVVVVDNGSTDGTSEWLNEMKTVNDVKVIHTDHVLGDGMAKNIGLKQSLGHIVVLMDTSVEITGDVRSLLRNGLADKRIGLMGPWGLLSEDLHHFHQEVSCGEADAVQAYFMAFQRDLLNEVGLMRETFRFYRNLDIDFSFQVKDKGYRVVADSTIPAIRHEHRQWFALGEEERDELSRKNFNLFLRRWRDRHDLLVNH